MSRECSVCAHIHRRSIEAAMVQDQPSRRIAADYGLNYQAVVRHRNNHLPAAIRAAAAEAVRQADVAQNVAAAPVRRRTRALQLTDSPAPAPPPPVSPAPAPASAPAGQAGSASAPGGVLNVYEQSIDLRDRAMALLEAAEAAGDIKTALTAIRESRGVLEHLSRLEERNQSRGPAVPLDQSPEWHRTRVAIIAALAEFPEARIAVAEALAGLGSLQ